MVLCCQFLFNILWTIHIQNNFNPDDLIDLSEYTNDLEEAVSEICDLLKSAHISSVCDIGRTLFTLLPKLEEHRILLDDFINLLSSIESDLNIEFLKEKLTPNKNSKKNNELVFENFKQSLMLANEILFLYKKNDEVKYDITEKLKNVDDVQSIFSVLLHYLEFQVVQEKAVFDKNLVIRELQKGRFILNDVITYIEFVALLFDYDECG